MGYDITRFVVEVDGEFICGICKDILNCPVVTECEHLYCRNCMFKDEPDRHSLNVAICPVDRCPLTKTPTPVPRYFLNLLNKLKLSCVYCSTICQLETVEAHERVCEKNPLRRWYCDGCSYELNPDSVDSHNCVEHLKMVVRNDSEELSKLRKERDEYKAKLHLERNENMERNFSFGFSRQSVFPARLHRGGMVEN